MSTRQNEKRILAIDVASRGFGYAVLEGPKLLIDWGVKETRENKRKKTLALTRDFLERYQPDLIVVEDYAAKGSRRCQRTRDLIGRIQELASAKGVKTKSFSRRAVKKVFSEGGATNRHRMATLVSWKFHELAPRLPPVRKLWMSEDPRMAMFNAVALAMTYFKKTTKAT